jgi:hypothetical protein
MDSLKIRIGPVSKVDFVKSGNAWMFDLPVTLVNSGDETLYIPNPEFSYMAMGCLNFCLVNRNGITIKNSTFVMAPLFGNLNWKKLKAGESIVFSEHIFISQSEGGNSGKTANNIEFFSNNHLGDGYKLKDGEYKLFAIFAYDNQFPKERHRWLKLNHLPSNEVELSKFWCGKIESNSLTLNLKSESD